MSFPGARRNFHICKYGLETGFFRTARIDAEPNLSGAFPHMADTHLGKVFTILGAFNAVVIFSAAEPIPHCLHIRRNSRCSPVGIAVIRYDAAKMLNGFIFIFYRSLQLVLSVQVHHNTALVKAVMALGEIRFHDE